MRPNPESGRMSEITMRGSNARAAMPVVALFALLGCGDERATGAGGSPSPESPAVAAGDTMPLEERRAIGGRVVFVSERGGSADVYAVSPDGSQETRLTEADSDDFPAAVAPDGGAVLVVSSAEEGPEQTEQMWIVPMDGGAPARLGPASARARSPSWAPDGGWVVFESDRRSFRDLYRARRGGGEVERLTENREGNFEPAVSPDGQWIAFASSRDGDAEIYVMRADGQDERRLTAFHRDDWAPRWSPDGGTIAFLSNREGRDRIYLVAPDGTDFRPLTRDSAAAEYQEADPAWSPDGRRIAFTRGTSAGVEVRVADLATGRSVAVRTPERGTARQPAWSPDGRYLAFVSGAQGEEDVWLARADGSGATRLTRAPGADWLPRWAGK